MSNSSATFIVGVIITLVSALADVLGYGTYSEFGVLQIVGTITGIILIILSIILWIVSKIRYR